MVKIPTTRGNTSLDVILTNMNNFTVSPQLYPHWMGVIIFSYSYPPLQILSILSQLHMDLTIFFLNVNSLY